MENQLRCVMFNREEFLIEHQLDADVLFLLEGLYQYGVRVLNLDGKTTKEDMEENKTPIPAPTSIREIQAQYPDDIVTLVKADTLAYRRLYDTKAVKKTLSIPRWLDTLAQEHGINFSNILQQALMKELDVSSR